MDTFKEFQGKDLDSAIEEACTYFNVSRNQLEIEIVRDAKTGIFGIVGTRKAEIRARRARYDNYAEMLRTAQTSEEAPPRASDDPSEQAKAPPEKMHAEKVHAEKMHADTPPPEHVAISEPDASQTSSPPSPSSPSSSSSPSSPASASTTSFDETQGQRAKKDRPRNVKREKKREAGALQKKNAEKNPERPLEERTVHVSLANDTWDAPIEEPNADEPHFHPKARERSPQRGKQKHHAGTQPVVSRKAIEARKDPEKNLPRAVHKGLEPPLDADGFEDLFLPTKPASTPKPRTEGEEPAMARGEGEHFSGKPMSSFEMVDMPSDFGDLPEDIPEGLPLISQEQLASQEFRETLSSILLAIIEPIIGVKVDLQFEVYQNSVRVHIDSGDHSGLLIGREGQTLLAIQYLTSRILTHKLGKAVRLQLDAGEYRQRQEEKLHAIAQSLADRARQTGRSFSTRPLSSYHRRIIHMSLKDAEDIQTRSIGDGSMKRVIIMCKRSKDGTS